MTRKLRGTTHQQARYVSAEVAAVSGDPGGDRLLKRSEVAEVLGASVSTVRRMEGLTLRPIVGERGEHLFHEEHVRALVVERTRVTSQSADGYDGVMAAAAFEIFDAGDGPVEVVKQLKADPRAVRTLLREWADLRGGFFVGAEVAAKLEKVAVLEGLFPVATDVQLLQILDDCQPALCECCARRPSRLCLSCVTNRRSEVEKLVVRRAARQDANQAARIDKAVSGEAVEMARSAVEARAKAHRGDRD